MSNRELAKSLIDQIPESRLFYVISYLQGAALPDETPNEVTGTGNRNSDSEWAPKFDKYGCPIL